MIPSDGRQRCRDAFRERVVIRGMQNIVRVWCALDERVGRSAQEIAESLGISRQTVAEHLNALEDVSLAFGVTPPNRERRNGGMPSIWRTRPWSDAAGKRRVRRSPPSSAGDAFAVFHSALVDGAALTMLTGLHGFDHQTARACLQIVREAGKARVTAYARKPGMMRGRWMSIVAWGSGPDAESPMRMSTATVTERARVRRDMRRAGGYSVFSVGAMGGEWPRQDAQAGEGAAA